MRVNQIKRAGTLNAILTAILAGFGVVASLGLLVAGLVVGAVVMPQLSPAIRMYIWDGAVILLIFFWMIGLLAQLQRAEAVSFDRVLHLPVSPAAAYLVNYLSSFFSVSLILIIPGMVGLALGQIYAAGPVMLLAFPLLTVFVVALTALTYQFQGWLAAQVENPRRRQMVVMLITTGFVLVSQVPGILHLSQIGSDESGSQSVEQIRRYEEVTRQLKAGQISAEESSRRTMGIPAEVEAEAAQKRGEKWDRIAQSTRVVNLVCPPGWLPLGMANLAEGRVLPALLGGLGLSLIGAGSLWRGYRATVRMYTHGGTGHIYRSAVVVGAERKSAKPSMVEWRLPWVSEYAAAVAAAGLRSLLRAPEARMMMLAPVILLIVFGGMFLSVAKQTEAWQVPLIAVGAAAMVLATSLQLGANQFGYDRDGFRAVVLSPVPRREVLIGKNLAMAPLVLGLGTVVVLLVGIGFQGRIDQVAAALVQLVTMYLPLCLIANACSIYAPFVVPSGSLKGARPGLKAVLTQMAAMMLAYPIAVGLPGILPAVIDVLVSEVGEVRGLPIALGLSLVCLAGSVWAYRRVITLQGQQLAEREQTILDVVTGHAQ